jgi:hypothetical protein
MAADKKPDKLNDDCESLKPTNILSPFAYILVGRFFTAGGLNGYFC